MELIITRHNGISIAHKGESQILFKGTWSIFFGKSKAEIFDANDNLIYKIEKKIKWLKFQSIYHIIDSNNKELKFTSENKKHSIYGLNIDDNYYQYRIHKGRKQSIFKNDKQVASIEDDFVSSFYKDSIRILADNDENIEILFLLIMCLQIGEENDSTVTFDFGQLLNMEPIDNNWQPNFFKP